MLPSHLYTVLQWGATLTRHLKLTLKSWDGKAGSHSAAAFRFTFFPASWCAAVIDPIHKLLRFIWLQIDNTIRLFDRAENFLSKFRNFGSAEALFSNLCDAVKIKPGLQEKWLQNSTMHMGLSFLLMSSQRLCWCQLVGDLARRDYNDNLGQSDSSLSDVLIDIWGELTLAVE